jgi:hypothetical protein
MREIPLCLVQGCRNLVVTVKTSIPGRRNVGAIRSKLCYTHKKRRERWGSPLALKCYVCKEIFEDAEAVAGGSDVCCMPCRINRAERAEYGITRTDVIKIRVAFKLPFPKYRFIPFWAIQKWVREYRLA